MSKQIDNENDQSEERNGLNINGVEVKRKKINIAIDGPAGSGKGTTAKELAKRLRYVYLDSGAIYRAVTLYFIDHNIDYKDYQLVKEGFKNIDISFNAENGEIYLNNKNVEKEIRSTRVAEKVSYFATQSTPELRDFVTEISQKIASQKGVVLEGRDATTVLDPHAELKIYLDADLKERARRRYKQMGDGCEDTFDSVLENLSKRDELDKENMEKGRKIALCVDTTHTTIEKQVSIIEEKVREILI